MQLLVVLPFIPDPVIVQHGELNIWHMVSWFVEGSGGHHQGDGEGQVHDQVTVATNQPHPAT